MSVIDNNTLLYLRGDSYTDLSPKKNRITNNNTTISDGAIRFGSGKSIYCNSFTTTINGTGNFTFEANIYINSTTGSQFSEFFTSIGEEFDGFIIYMEYGKLRVCVGYESEDDVETSITLPLKKWFHLAVVRRNEKITIYIDGVSKKTYSSTTYVTIEGFIIGTHSEYDGDYFDGSMKNISFSNMARYTSNFTPTEQPATGMSIQNFRVENDRIRCSISNPYFESWSKMELLANGKVFSTTTSSVSTLDYAIDSSVLNVGNNTIALRIYYYQNYYIEATTTYNYVLPVEIENLTINGTQLSFNISKPEGSTYEKIDILLNGEVIHSLGNNSDSIIYDIPSDLPQYGLNNVEVRVYMDDIYYNNATTSFTKEITLDSFEPIEDLASTSNLTQVMYRFQEIDSVLDVITSNLVTILNTQGIETGENPRLSELVTLASQVQPSGLDIICESSLPATGKNGQMCILSDNPVNNFMLSSDTSLTPGSNNTIVIYTKDGAYNYSSNSKNLSTRLCIPKVLQGTESLYAYYWTGTWEHICGGELFILDGGLSADSSYEFSLGTYWNYDTTNEAIYAPASSTYSYYTSYSRQIDFSLYNTIEIVAWNGSTSVSKTLYIGPSTTQRADGRVATLSAAQSYFSAYKSYTFSGTSTQTITLDISDITTTGYLTLATSIANSQLRIKSITLIG